jgi:iron complex outermembrane recepter protein
MSQREVSAQEVYRSRLNQWARRALAGAVATALIAAAPVLYAQQSSPPAQSDADAPAPAAAAAPAAAGGNEALQEIVVTGTRTLGLEAAESPAPLQVLSANSLQTAAATPDLMNTLAQIVPSFQEQAFGFDMAGQTIMANLYGLSPNDVLVLVDGKRRHTTANLAVDTGSEYTGAASADLNFIPVDAIDHVEVLTEGAAAQYGSDAVAGVINIILKKNTSGGLISGTTGGYFDGGFGGNGATGDASVNWGFAPIDGAYLNITAETHNHAHSDHTAIDERVINPANLATYPDSNETQVQGYPYLNHIIGDGEYHMKLVSVNSGYDFTSDSELYLFGTWGSKEANSYENYRPPAKICYPVVPNTPANVIAGTVGECEPDSIYPFPFGFNPQEEIDETDYQVTGGFKTVIAGWRFDLASAYGVDHVPQYTINTAADEIGFTFQTTSAPPTLQNYYDGLLQATQWTNTLDIARDFDVGLASPLNVAFGGEYRRDTYTLGVGVPASYLDGGAQSFPGLTPPDAGIHSRENYAEYVDLAFKPIDPVRLDIAGRHERYTDFGNTNVGKFTGRWDISPQFAVRGTVQNGFRAPTLAEEYYTSTNVAPTTAFVQLAPNSPGGRLLGLGNGLQPEKSINYSVGFVYRPIPRIVMTLDAYEVIVHNRITNSGSVLGTAFGTVVAPEVVAAIEANGNELDPQVVDTGLTGINVFTNGMNTLTRGLDLNFNFPTRNPFGNLTYSIGANYNAASYTYVRPPPPSLAGQALFDLTALSSVTNIQPEFKINLGVDYSFGPFEANLVEILYGRQQQWQNDDADNGSGGPITNCASGVPSNPVCQGVYEYYVNNTPDVTAITNLTLSWTVREHLTISVGAQNLFNKFPPGLNPTELAHEDNFFYGDSAGTDGQMLFVPYGINGGYYFAKAVLRY